LTDSDEADHIKRMLNDFKKLKKVNLFLITLDALDKDVFKIADKILTIL